MTRRYFTKLAKALHRAKPADSKHMSAWWALVAEVAIICANGNPRFDTDKFLDTCSEGEHAKAA